MVISSGVICGAWVIGTAIRHLRGDSLLITDFYLLLFVARPIAVFSSLLPFRFGIREIGFISWVGLRGAVPITLAIIPVTMAVPGADLAFNITFGMVILSLLVQGATIPLMSRLFRVWVPTNNEPKAEHEIWVADQANITLYEFEVKQGAFAIGRHPQSISSKFDAQALSLFALVRHNKLVNVNEDTILKMGDVVWYAMRGDDAPSIAKIFNNSATQYQKIVSFMAIGYCLLMHALQICHFIIWQHAHLPPTHLAAYQSLLPVRLIYSPFRHRLG